MQSVVLPETSDLSAYLRDCIKDYIFAYLKKVYDGTIVYNEVKNSNIIFNSCLAAMHMQQKIFVNYTCDELWKIYFMLHQYSVDMCYLQSNLTLLRQLSKDGSVNLGYNFNFGLPF